MITKISCGRAGQIVYNFDNGNEVSFLWSWGSYSDNHPTSVAGTAFNRIEKQDWESKTVEVYSMGHDNNGFTNWLKRKYGQNPAAFVDVSQIPTILKRADKAVKSES